MLEQVQNPRRPPSPRAARARLVRLVLGVVAGLGLLSGPTCAGAAADSGPPVALGANTGVLFNSHKYSRADIDRQLAALAATGATTVRSDAPWESAEPDQPSTGIQLSPPYVGVLHHYDWRRDDLIAGELARHGLRWLPVIDYSAPWAQSIPGDDHSPPKSVADYAAYAGALAARYGPGGSFWAGNPNLTPEPVDAYEIWNEPDSRFFWHSSPNPAAYADLYLSARAAIVTAQPSAHVLVGGLTNPAWFLPALVASHPQIQAQIGGVAIHPYGITPEHVLSNVRAARLNLRAEGLGAAPLYITEFGWTTHPANSWDWAPAAARPGYIERTLAGLGRTDCGIAAVLMYTWATPQRDPSNLEDWYGISPPGAATTADTRAFASGLHEAASSGPVSRLCSGPDPLAAAKTASKRPRPARPHKRRPRHHPKHRTKPAHRR